MARRAAAVAAPPPNDALQLTERHASGFSLGGASDCQHPFACVLVLRC